MVKNRLADEVWVEAGGDFGATKIMTREADYDCSASMVAFSNSYMAIPSSEKARSEPHLWWTVVKWFGSEIRHEVSEIKDQSPFVRARYDSEFISFLGKMIEYFALIMNTASWPLAPAISDFWNICLNRILSTEFVYFSHMEILVNSWHSGLIVRASSQKQEEQGKGISWTLSSGHCCLWTVLAFGHLLPIQSDTLFFGSLYLCLPEVQSCKVVYLHQNVVTCSNIETVSSPMLGSKKPFMLDKCLFALCF
ncbi:hypothetical protein V6N11_060476 [Hibiscus sabdariffa]|uniref:Uncharacterized protein n=1 Tax=Hibiscus sabdariffa TaxID=183260 RepID=A0ABR2QR07_9ROSI